MASSSVRCCCSRSSRRSLASALCVMAARCSEPSGLATILIGDTSTPLRADWPLRNAGSCSLMSTSNSSSTSSSTFMMPCQGSGALSAPETHRHADRSAPWGGQLTEHA